MAGDPVTTGVFRKACHADRAVHETVTLSKTQVHVIGVCGTGQPYGDAVVTSVGGAVNESPIRNE